MNYFRVQSFVQLGWQSIPVEIECAQSRRLPFLHVLGASAGPAAELRERVIAAIESTGTRFPARRITVRFLPAVPGLPLEDFDVAVALAVLAAGEKVPRARVENALISGSLSLDGQIVGLGGEFAARRLFASGRYRSALVPAGESAWLRGLPGEAGRGFHSLTELLAYLKGENTGVRCEASTVERILPPEISLLSARNRRLAEIAAAGFHHVLLQPSAPETALRVASLVDAWLPRSAAAEAERASLLRSEWARRESGAAKLRPIATLRGRQRADDTWAADQFLRASHGVLCLPEAQDAWPLLTRWSQLKEERIPTLDGAGAEFSGLVVAALPACRCRERVRCRCGSLERGRHQERVEAAQAFPFGVRGRQEAPLEHSAGADFAAVFGRIQGARARMLTRQGVPNGRLAPAEAGSQLAWSDRARFALEGRDELAAVAVTIADLRGGERVEEADVLEARHYGLAGAADARSGASD